MKTLIKSVFCLVVISVHFTGETYQASESLIKNFIIKPALDSLINQHKSNLRIKAFSDQENKEILIMVKEVLDNTMKPKPTFSR